MITSIQQFCQNGVQNLEKVMVDYSADMTKIAEMVQGVTEGVVSLGLSIFPSLQKNGKDMMKYFVPERIYVQNGIL